MELNRTEKQEINNLVAEHVFGWKRGDGSITSTMGRPCLLHIWTTDKGRPEEDAPDACGDGNVMLDVIDTMRSKGVDQGGDGYDIESMIWTGTSWQVRFVFDVSKEIARAWHMPRAVAIAALKALRIEVKR